MLAQILTIIGVIVLAVIALALLRLELVRFRERFSGFPEPAPFGFRALLYFLVRAPLWALYVAVPIFFATTSGWIFLLGLVVFFFGFGLLHKEEPQKLTRPMAPGPKQIAGRRIRPQGAAAADADRLRSPDDPGLFWGGPKLPAGEANKHWCLVGATRSGKTLSMKLLMLDVLPLIQKGFPADLPPEKQDGLIRYDRAVVYDPKPEFLPFFGALGLCNADLSEGCVKTLHPYDARSFAWDIAADVTDPSVAGQIAAGLIPPRPHASGDNPFFREGARAIVKNIMVGLHAVCREDWGLRDVIHIGQDPDRFKLFFECAPRELDLVRTLKKFFKPEKTFQNVINELGVALENMEPVAALWHHASKRIPLTDWSDGRFILHLASDATIDESVRPANAAMFRRLFELVLAKPDRTPERSWFFIDELAEAGRLERLRYLMAKGAAFGACVVLGFQDLHVLKGPEFYGLYDASGILGQCNNVAVFGLNSVETAEWASKFIGNKIVKEFTVTDTTSDSKPGEPPGQSYALQEHIAERDHVTVGELIDMKLADLSSGLTGWYSAKLLGAYKAHVPGHVLAKAVTGGLDMPGPCDVPAFVPRPKEHQYLPPWTEEDDRRVGLSIEEEDPNPKRRRLLD